MDVAEIIKLAKENSQLNRFVGDLVILLNTPNKAFTVQSYNEIPESGFIFNKIRELKGIKPMDLVDQKSDNSNS